MAIHEGDNGFLMGERRLREIAQGINQTEENTREILTVLAETLRQMQQQAASQDSSTTVRDSVTRRNRGGAAGDASGSPSPTSRTRTTVDAAEEILDNLDQASRRTRRRTTTVDAEGDGSASSDVSSASGRAAAARERDANGRFTGGGSSGGSESEKGFLGRLKSMLGFGGMGVEAGGVDPTVDALLELNQALSPVKKLFTGMSAKAIGIFRGRMKRRQSDEVLPAEQVEANEEQADNGRRQNKFLKSILSAIRAVGGGGGLGGGLGGRGLLRGLMGGLLGGGKALLKKIPLLGALLGGGMLASNWGGLDSGGKGKGIGQIVGTLVGGALGSFFGPLGTVAGGGLGNYLGGIFGQKIGTWTDSLKKIDFGGIFKELMSAVLNIGKKAAAFIPFAPGTAGYNAMQGAKDWIKDKFSSDSSGGTTATVGDNIDYSSAPDNVNSEGNVATDRKARQLGMYNALRKQGFTHEQSLAVGGEIGRENDYGDALFSTHIDKARDEKGNQIKNGGALSWNRERYAKFAAHMRAQGQMDANGNIPKTQAALDAQAGYIKQEFSEKQYSKHLKKFNSNPNADPREFVGELAPVIGWARGQKTVRGPNGTRIPFDSQPHEKKINTYIDSGAAIAKNQSNKQPAKSIQAGKGTAQQQTLIPKGLARPVPIKVPAITPELTKIGTKYQARATSAPSDGGIGQTVSDRSLAHVLSGGLGFNQYNA